MPLALSTCAGNAVAKFCRLDCWFVLRWRSTSACTLLCGKHCGVDKQSFPPPVSTGVFKAEPAGCLGSPGLSWRRSEKPTAADASPCGFCEPFGPPPSWGWGFLVSRLKKNQGSRTAATGVGNPLVGVARSALSDHGVTPWRFCRQGSSPFQRRSAWRFRLGARPICPGPALGAA